MNGAPLAFAVPGRLDTPTGGFLYDRRIVEGLRARGRRVEVLELPEGFPLAPLADEALRARAVERLERLPDGTATVLDGLAAGVLPDAVARLAGRLPLTLLVHHPLAAETGLAPGQAQRLQASETAALAAAPRVVATSCATAEDLVRDYGVPAERLVVVPPGTDPAPLAAGSGDAAPLLLSVGSLIPRKGQDLLVEALAGLAELPWRLVLAGGARDAGYAERLRGRVAELGLDGRVEFLGEVPPERIAGLYAAADLYLQPSRLEGYGMAIAEALARGLPVVCGERAAIVRELPPGSLASVPADEPAALAAALRPLIEDGRRRAELAAGARRARERLPGWPAAAAAFAAALEAAGTPAAGTPAAARRRPGDG